LLFILIILNRRNGWVFIMKTDYMFFYF
jgi:hypothetical protein